MVTAVKPRAPARALLNAADLDIPFAMNVMAVTHDFWRKNPDTVERAMRAYIEAVALMHHDKDTTLKVLQKYFNGAIPVSWKKCTVSLFATLKKLPASTRAMLLRLWNSNRSKASMPNR